jgi:dienelactone hydrolase
MLMVPSLLGSPDLRRPTTCGRGRLFARWFGYPLGGGSDFVRTFRPSKQFEVVIPTLILIGALDEWTPAADCSDKIDGSGTDGVPIEQVVYPSVHHSFYYPELQPGRKIFGRWAEYNEEAATDASRRMREFLKRHLN